MFKLVFFHTKIKMGLVFYKPMKKLVRRVRGVTKPFWVTFWFGFEMLFITTFFGDSHLKNVDN